MNDDIHESNIPTSRWICIQSILERGGKNSYSNADDFKTQFIRHIGKRVDD